MGERSRVSGKRNPRVTRQQDCKPRGGGRCEGLCRPHGACNTLLTPYRGRRLRLRRCACPRLSPFAATRLGSRWLCSHGNCRHCLDYNVIFEYYTPITYLHEKQSELLKFVAVCIVLLGCFSVNGSLHTRVCASPFAKNHLQNSNAMCIRIKSIKY